MIKFNIINKEYEIRLFDIEKDSVSDLTVLLHRSYKRLADMDLHFIATFQDEEYTRNYLNKGDCFVLTDSGKIIGTIFYYTEIWADAPEIYKRPGVVLFGKFAVDPGYQNMGLGSKLMDFIENYALENSKSEIVLDTSEKAFHLIDYYNKRGYRFEHYWQWRDVNYRSVIMAKKLKRINVYNKNNLIKSNER